MISPAEIDAQKERLYESTSLRDDMNDEEATVLLKWAEQQIERIAQTFPPDEFEQKCRFLRQMVKGINRFVGQREFNDLDGQHKYLSKAVMYFEPLGFVVTEDELFSQLPDNPADMMGNLKAILDALITSSKL